MRFLSQFQRRRVIGPLNTRQFTEAAWNEDFERLGEDDADANLHRAGLWVHSKFQKLWSARYLPDSNLNSVTKIRAVLGFGNQAAYRVFAGVNEALQRELQSEQVLVALKPFSWRVPSTNGEHASPDELLQAIENGIRLSVGDILRAKEGMADWLRGNATYRKVDWRALQGDFQLGVQFDAVRELWGDIVWNGFQLKSYPDASYVLPSDTDWLVRYRASESRMQYLFMQHLSQAYQFFRTLPLDSIKHSAPKSIRRVVRSGGEYKIAVGDKTDVDFEKFVKWHAATSYATEPYYGELLSASYDALAGASVRDLFAAWWTLQNVTGELFQFERSRDEDEMHTWIADYVPVLEVESLARAISSSTDVSLARARALVSFLTFDGDYSQELYSQPLVPVGSASVCPCLAAIRAPNTRRLIDMWIRQLGVDLELRGPAFERYMREEVAASVQSSPMLNVGRMLHDAMNFVVPDGHVEEIDLVVVVDKLVLVGEVKCMLQPTEASEIARHRERVIEAAAQVQRKANSIAQNREAFRTQLSAAGIQCDADFELIALVVLNTSVHAGFPINDVPVVDELMLRVFFMGELNDAILGGQGAEQKVVKRHALYEGLDGIAGKAAEYFRAPPQLDVWKHSVSRRTITVGAVSADDTVAFYETVECSPRIDAMMPEVGEA